MKNEKKNRKHQLTSLPISINLLKVALVAAVVYYFGVKFLFAVLLLWAVRQMLRLFFITLKLLFWGLITLFILYAII
mgnify:FL=1